MSDLRPLRSSASDIALKNINTTTVLAAIGQPNIVMAIGNVPKVNTQIVVAVLKGSLDAAR